ncbi:MAG: AAA family ATPase [Pseudomonadota bacterium]
MNAQQPNPLPVLKAAQLAQSEPQTQWLLDKLWAYSAVGIVGGPPKSCKTWLALDMAVSLASGTPCLGLFPPRRPGRVLLYAAEDSQAILKQRLAAICNHRQLALADLEIFVITADHLRLDLLSDQKSLTRTVENLKPDLLLLDPLVRLHRINENDAGEVSGLLDYLRTLQRQCQVAITLVHHTRKNNSSGPPGQTLRGSSDLHAWSDCSLYLRRRKNQFLLVAEHRASQSPPAVELSLVDGPHPHLEVVAGEPDFSGDLGEDILHLLKQAQAPVTRTAMREQLKTRNERLGKALLHLEQCRLVEHSAEGWRIAVSGHVA